MFVLGIVGIAGNQMRLATGRTAWLLLAKNWLRGCLAGGRAARCRLGLRAAGTDFDPFHGGEVSYAAAVPIAALLVLAGFCLQPVAVWLVARFYPDADRPAQINYTQNWVQMVVVVPLMAAGYLVAAILWGESTGAAGGPDLAALDSYGAVLPDGLALLAVSPVGGLRVDLAALVLRHRQPQRTEGLCSSHWARRLSRFPCFTRCCAR